MDCLVVRYFLVELIGIFNRTVLYTGSATRALILDNVSGFLDKGYLEITSFSLYAVNFSIRQDLNIWMPADLDQFGREYSHGAVIGGIGLVELRHMPTNGR